MAQSTQPLTFAVGIEDTFIPQSEGHLRPLDEYALTQHYDRWQEDVELVAQSGASAIRYGIPWYRVNPERGRFDWSWTDGVLDALLERNVTPIIDLMHYGCPQWLDRQFANPDYPTAVADYAKAAADRYGDRIAQWTPMNEPLLNALFCGLEGRWPPGLTGDNGFVNLVGQLAEGIVRTQAALRDTVRDFVSVQVEATFRWTGQGPTDGHLEFLRDRNWLVYDLLFGRVDDRHPLWGYLTRNGFSDEQATFFAEHPTEPDIMGINYYPHLTTRRLIPDGTSRYVWGGTEGLEELIRAFHERYDKPLFLTETSVAGTVDLRSSWMDESVELVHQLRAEGVPMVGYTWWPLFSLIDWDVRESGLPPEEHLVHMGLWDLVPDGGGELERRATPLIKQFHALTVPQANA